MPSASNAERKKKVISHN